MREVVRRRYSRAVEEGTPLPQLIIADGGKGQMEVIREVIEDELHLDIKIAGLVKDGRHRTSELIVGKSGESIGLKQNSALFRLMTQIQDEVHRFAITFHRKLRGKRNLVSVLDHVEGIGPKRRQELWKKFKTLDAMKQASVEELAAVEGMNYPAAQTLYDFFRMELLDKKEALR